MNPAIKLIAGLAIVATGAFTAFLATPQRVAPEARFATLGGESFTTSDLRGKVTVVNFWATWCPDCVREMPSMAERHLKYSPRGYEMIAVAMSYDHPNEVARFAQTRALPFKVALDGDGAISRSFGDIRATPTTFLIDKRGRILKQYLGEPEWSEFHALVERALGDPA